MRTLYTDDRQVKKNENNSSSFFSYTNLRFYYFSIEVGHEKNCSYLVKHLHAIVKINIFLFDLNLRMYNV